MNATAKALLFTVLGIGLGAGLTWSLRTAAAAHGAPSTGAPAPGALRYQCPMHPQVVLDQPGNCPVCGMTLVPREQGAPKESGRIAFYRSPMNPSLTSPVPMKDEMGMDYVPVREGDLHSRGAGMESHAAVSIDSERQQLIGLRTEKVVEGAVGGEFRSLGRVAVDETRVRKVNVKVEGYVERLYVDFVGKPVSKGQPLFTIYSPELLAAQSEFLLALRTRKSLAGSAELARSGEELVASARRRLGLWDIPASALETLERTGQPTKTLTIVSPASGVVTAKNVVEGARLAASDTPFEITDLSRVWVLVDVYESELGLAKVGTSAELTLQASPGRTFHGRVAFVDPLLDPRTRTAKARLEFPNPHGDLKPEMFGEVLLRGPRRTGIVVPLDAVLDGGATKVAFVALGDGKFEPREVTTGTAVGDKVEIRSGLKVGEAVVVRASFLIDSESRLKAALAQMGAKPRPAPVDGPAH